MQAVAKQRVPVSSVQCLSAGAQARGGLRRAQYILGGLSSGLLHTSQPAPSVLAAVQICSQALNSAAESTGLRSPPCSWAIIGPPETSSDQREEQCCPLWGLVWAEWKSWCSQVFGVCFKNLL